MVMNMNYLAEIKAFYMICAQNSIPASSQALWHRLLAYDNEFCWIKEFTLTNVRLADDLCVSRQALDRARNVLIQNGLIKYKKGTGNKCGIYEIVSLCNKKHMQNDTQSGHKADTPRDTVRTQYDTQYDTQAVPLNKLNKTKQNKKENKKEKIEAYTNDEQLQETLNDFLKYRDELKKPLTSQGLTRLLHKLDKLSEPYQDTERYKRECLNQSMVKSWQDVFALKDGEFEDKHVKSEEQKQTDADFADLYGAYEEYVHSFDGSFEEQLDFEQWRDKHAGEH